MCGRLPFGKGFRDVDAKLVGCSHVSGLLVAARIAAGPNAIHGSGPIQLQALEAPWAKRVFPTPGPTDFALRHIHSAKFVNALLAGDLAGNRRGLAIGHVMAEQHPGNARRLVGQRHRRDLGWFARDQIREPGYVGATTFGMADDGHRARD